MYEYLRFRMVFRYNNLLFAHAGMRGRAYVEAKNENHLKLSPCPTYM